jgi:precorrin-6B methylase 2
LSPFYPSSIEARIRELRGDWFDDEIARETDPAYSEQYLRAALFSFGANLDGTRIMDLGCGAGASTIVLARLVPTASSLGWA